METAEVPIAAEEAGTARATSGFGGRDGAGVENLVARAAIFAKNAALSAERPEIGARDAGG
jgi:hypothetical protein